MVKRKKKVNNPTEEKCRSEGKGGKEKVKSFKSTKLSQSIMSNFPQKLTSSPVAQSGLREQNLCPDINGEVKGNQCMRRQTLTAITVLKPVS